MKIRSLHPSLLVMPTSSIVLRQWANPSGPQYVYFFWGSNHRRPLYIGRTWDPGFRLASHRKKQWFPKARTVWVASFPDAGATAEAEKRFIKEFNPIYNKLRYQ